MARSLTLGRAFERSNRARFVFETLKSPPKHAFEKFEARRRYFERLMQVSIHHTFYNASDTRCLDFNVIPTRETEELMASLGLLLKIETTGFSVLYDTGQSKNLVRYLKRQRQPGPGSPPEPEFWTRLSFMLSLNDPYFINFTRLPIDLNPNERNLYFTNQQAHEESPSPEPILNPGRFVSVSNPEQDLLPVVPVEVPVPVTAQDQKVAVRAISGELVICQNRCLPTDLVYPEREPEVTESYSEWYSEEFGTAPALGNATAITCQEVSIFENWYREQYGKDPEVTCRDKVYLDFALLPEDKYTIDLIPTDPLAPVRHFNVLYTAAYPIPLCFIDLLFSRPKPGEPGIYPVGDLFRLPEVPAAKIESIHYLLAFRRRSTVWRYFIVPQPQTESFENLRIVQLDHDLPCRLASRVDFGEPELVLLDNGQKAYRFVSQQPISLQQQSSYCFRLKGMKGQASHERVLVDRLPVASNRQVLPEGQLSSPESPSKNYSDIYVYV